jgi:hypothetical protein
MKKLTSDTTKHISPKVSSRGNFAKWVSGRGSVFGSTSATSTIYTHPAKPYSASVRLAAKAI